MTMQRVDLFGSAWQPADISTPCPMIFGDVTRDTSKIVAVVVGVDVKSVSARSNAADVAAAFDAVTVQRLPGEPFYCGSDPDTLVQRVAAMCGTARPWMLVYG